MRRPALDRWLRRELMALSGLGRFSLPRLAAMSQSTHPRLAEPLWLYCRETGRTAQLTGLVWDGEVAEAYRRAGEALGDRSLADLALSGAACDLLGRDFGRHLDSFAADWRRPERDARSKRLRLERCRSLVREKGPEIAPLCRKLGLDPGNVSAFLARGELGRLTLADATALMHALAAL